MAENWLEEAQQELSEQPEEKHPSYENYQTRYWIGRARGAIGRALKAESERDSLITELREAKAALEKEREKR